MLLSARSAILISFHICFQTSRLDTGAQCDAGKSSTALISLHRCGLIRVVNILHTGSDEGLANDHDETDRPSLPSVFILSESIYQRDRQFTGAGVAEIFFLSYYSHTIVFISGKMRVCFSTCFEQLWRTVGVGKRGDFARWKNL